MKKCDRILWILAAATVLFLAKRNVLAAPEIMPDGGIFDAEYYAQMNPDVAGVLGTDRDVLYEHYKTYGRAEARLPFDPAEDIASHLSVSSTTVKEFYGNAVFIGDSIMNGFRNYSSRGTVLTHGAQFLSASSYSAVHALNEEDELHPLFRGVSQPVWESIPMMDVDEVFIMFGTNEIGIFTPEETALHIELLAQKILDAKPDVHIHLISMTPVYITYTKLNNKNVNRLNELLQETAERRNWGYVNVHDRLCTGRGVLRMIYTSDKYVHLNNMAYRNVWITELDRYAQETLRERALRQLSLAVQEEPAGK